MRKPDEHHCRPDFAGLKARLYEKGCREESQEIYLGSGGDVAPREKYIVNPATGESICSEHWIDSEEVTAEFCDHVCRSLGFEENEVSFFATDGEEVTVSMPPPAAARITN